LICVQDIDTNFACIVGFSGSAISNMLPKISRELPWQPNLEKNEPKLYKTSCLDRIVRRRNVVNGSEDMFLWILVRICGLIKKKHFPLLFAKIDKIAYTCNSKDAKHSNRNNLICVLDIYTIFACIIGFSKLHRLYFCARNRGLFRTNSKVFWVSKFEYAIQNFKGAKGVAMATKFRQK